MSRTLDVNILVYASDETSRYSEQARAVVTDFAAGPSLATLLGPVVVGYLRLATHPRISERPLTYRTAAGNIDRLLARPHIRLAGDTPKLWSALRSVADPVEPRGNLIADAYLVALMRAHGIETMVTHDRDFRLFDGIRIVDPFRSDP